MRSMSTAPATFTLSLIHMLTEGTARTPLGVVVAAALVATIAYLHADASSSSQLGPASTTQSSNLEHAQRLFYSARYEEAAALTLCSSDADDLVACELRTSALHFQIKRALGGASDKGNALKRCATCPELLSTFMADVARGQAVARARLEVNPGDEAMLFLLGKLDLNYVWLQLGTLGRRTGWGQYWEARRSLDTVLAQNPGHLRARVARAWIDYIVDTKMPRGTRWVLGGGNKKQGLAVVREAASTDAELFIRAEAGFALWEMLVRERKFSEAVATAQGLARDFPDNQELRKFLETHESGLRP